MSDRDRTHWVDCWRSHGDCAAAEVERLLAEQYRHMDNNKLLADERSALRTALAEAQRERDEARSAIAQLQQRATAAELVKDQLQKALASQVKDQIREVLQRGVSSGKADEVAAARIEAAERRAERLEKWVKHYSGCSIKPCDCGLDAALRGEGLKPIVHPNAAAELPPGSVITTKPVDDGGSRG